ncbi:hypothetical protein [Wenyingzhuangia sp. IMCC45467]
MGYIIPRTNEKKYKEYLEVLKLEIKGFRNEFKTSVSFLDMVRLYNENNIISGIKSGLNCLKYLSEVETYKNAKRTRLAFGYMIKLTKKISNSKLDEIIKEKSIDYNDLIEALNKSKYKNEYITELNEFRQNYK